MAFQNVPIDPGDRMDQLEARIQALETMKQLETSSLRQGQIVILGASGQPLPSRQPLPLQAGEVARLGLQPDGTYGMRLLDGSSNVIFDPIGIQQVMKSIGGLPATGLLAAQAFTLTDTNYPGTNGTFTLTRAGNVLVMSQFTHFTNGGTASYGRGRISVFNSAAALVGQSPRNHHTNGSGVTPVYPYVLLNGLPADTYTVWIQYSMDAGATTTFQLLSAQWDAFLLGG